MADQDGKPVTDLAVTDVIHKTYEKVGTAFEQPCFLSIWVLPGALGREGWRVRDSGRCKTPCARCATRLHHGRLPACLRLLVSRFFVGLISGGVAAPAPVPVGG